MTLPRALIAALVCALALVPGATAGGWWSFPHLDRKTVAVGERVRLQSEAWFPSLTAARNAEENERFYVYLLRGLDGSMVDRAMMKPFRRNWWSPGDAEVMRVAPVRLDMAGSNLSSVRVSFTLPELALGTYGVMLCDAGCEHPLGTVVPTPGFRVVADPATAHLARRLERLRARTAKQRRRVTAARAAAGEAQLVAEAVGSELGRLRTRVDALERRSRVQPERGSPSVWWLAGWPAAAAFALALAVLLVRRRSRSPLGWSAEDEVLLASELSRPRRARTPSH
jgi:hypothetical protein